MKALLQFFVRYYIVLLFLVLETVAFVLFFYHNKFQQSAILTSSNRVAASIYEVENSLLSYFSLRQENDMLAEENFKLKNRINALENRLENIESDTIDYVFAEKNIEYMSAKVIHGSVNQHSNYFTINRGLRDGVELDMSVCNPEGVVGVVSAVSKHYAVVMPIINEQLTISCKFKKNGQIGLLNWHGGKSSVAKLEDIARHNDVCVGDTILTSGLSAIFPSDIPVGVVSRVNLKESDAYYDIDVDLAVDFRSINNVYVIKQNLRQELLDLEKEQMK
ncbi:MAG: rod shape-determining protein MreC [Paludibacteraceae bacterium]|nr:rod shape-determining protein MreC [Paludibacteraceae bacterium]